jgi:KipI family sensor histidine kinase inhibitor
MTAGAPLPRVVPFGEAAVLAVLGDEVTLPLARRSRALALALEGIMRGGDPRWRPPIPGAASVLVPFDPLAIAPGEALVMVEELLAALPASVGPDARARHITIPVRYGGVDGPDLEAVAEEIGWSPRDVVALHAATEYEVAFLGFAPGFAYLAEVPQPLVVPRLATPRTRVPAGSVGIAGRLTGIYPAASPGGWRILGRTDLALFDPGADPPARLRPGDLVRFAPATDG